MELFENDHLDFQPLAARMRPQTLDEYVGQNHILGEGRLLKRIIKKDRLSSIILYGPPGSGKTTLAKVIANHTKSSFVSLNAVLSGVKELREEIENAKNRKSLNDIKTILFIDEVHRWNKSQQDALLPWVENGTIILIGATTENPYFEVNKALVSRSRVFPLFPLNSEDLKNIATNVIKNSKKGYGNFKISFEKGALEHLIDTANGDARNLLNALELAIETSVEKFPPEKGETIKVALKTAEESIQQKVVLYDKGGDYHYDTISAFIKSIRGSDPDATLYWLAKMLVAGEDPKFIFRRMIISASEDIGLADPNALVIVEAAASAYDRIGLPEGQFMLSQAALYLATTKKSNTTLSLFDAIESVKNTNSEIPDHLKDANRDKKHLGHGENYLYPHAYKDHWVAQQYLPNSLQGKIFYNPSNQGYEAKIAERIKNLRELQLATVINQKSGDIFFEGKIDDRELNFINKMVNSQNRTQEDIRDNIFHNITIKNFFNILDLNCCGGIFLWTCLRKVPNGSVWTITNNKDEIELITHYSKNLNENIHPNIIESVEKIPPIKFEVIIGKDLWTKKSDIEKSVKKISEFVDSDIQLSFTQTLPVKSTKISEIAEKAGVEKILIDLLKNCEATLFCENNSGFINSPEDIITEFKKLNIIFNKIEKKELFENVFVSTKLIDIWFNSESGYGKILPKEELPKIIEEFNKKVAGKTFKWKRELFFIKKII